MMLTTPPVNPPAVVATADARLLRLRSDFGFWARNCYKILDKSGRLVPLKLNPVQRSIEAEEQRQLATKGEARLLALKGRQGGVTTYEQAKSLHQIWKKRGSTALTLAHDRDSTDKIFGITQRAIDEFDPALLPRLGQKATREISFPGRDSRFYTGTAGARRTGRGLTLVRLHGSEFAFWDKPLSTLNTVGPALVPNGSTVALETTGGGYDSEPHHFWRAAVAGLNGYTALFYPWWECDPVNYRRKLDAPDELGKLSDEEQILVDHKGLDLEQIKWRRLKIAEMQDKNEFLQEYAEDPESCWMAVGGMVFDAETLKALLLRAPTPIAVDSEGELEIYGELGPGETAILGADTAEGVGQDASTAVVRARKTRRLLAVYKSRRIQPKQFAGVVDSLGRQFGNAFLVIEKNMHGITVLRALRDDHLYPLESIYHRPILDQELNEKKERIGWATTGESKPIMIDAARELFKAAKDGFAGVPSADAIRDAFGVRRDEKGKADLNGKDVLVAEMLCWIGQSAPTDSGMLDYFERLAAEAEAKKNGR